MVRQTFKFRTINAKSATITFNGKLKPISVGKLKKPVIEVKE